MLDDDLRDVFAARAAGVAVVATRDREGFRGLTATSLTSVSLDPPLLLVGLDRLTQTRDAVAAAGTFTVSLLERRQEFVAERFAGRAPLVQPDWADVPHDLTMSGLPIVRGSVAWFECTLRELRPAGDHDLALGELVRWGRGGGEPLVLWDRAYWGLA